MLSGKVALSRQPEHGICRPAWVSLAFGRSQEGLVMQPGHECTALRDKRCTVVMEGAPRWELGNLDPGPKLVQISCLTLTTYLHFSLSLGFVFIYKMKTYELSHAMPKWNPHVSQRRTYKTYSFKCF